MTKLYLNIKEKESLRLNKNFQHESVMLIMAIFEESAKNDKIFLGKKIDLNNKLLSVDRSALTVDKNNSILNIQFLFIFLNISHIFVTENGKLKGVITKEDFVRKTS